MDEKGTDALHHILNIIWWLLLGFIIFAPSVSAMVSTYDANTFFEMQNITYKNWSFSNNTAEIEVSAYTITGTIGEDSLVMNVPAHKEFVSYPPPNVKTNQAGFDLQLQLMIVTAVSSVVTMLIMVIILTWGIIQWVSARRGSL